MGVNAVHASFSIVGTASLYDVPGLWFQGNVFHTSYGPLLLETGRWRTATGTWDGYIKFKLIRGMRISWRGLQNFLSDWESYLEGSILLEGDNDHFYEFVFSGGKMSIETTDTEIGIHAM